MNPLRTMQRPSDVKKRDHAVNRVRRDRIRTKQLYQICELVRKAGMSDDLMDTLIRIKKS